jgi:hypothetical protein
VWVQSAFSNAKCDIIQGHVIIVSFMMSSDLDLTELGIFCTVVRKERHPCHALRVYAIRVYEMT